MTHCEPSAANHMVVGHKNRLLIRTLPGLLNPNPSLAEAADELLKRYGMLRYTTPMRGTDGRA